MASQRANLPPGFQLRRARREDGAVLLRLIRSLAEFEHLPPPDPAAEQRLIEHGFGEHPRFEAWLVIDGEGQGAGYAILFETYSSFRARPTLFLEDLFVLPDFRGCGIGTAMLRHFSRLAFDRGCGRMEWTCLDWNTRAQGVYERIGARRLSDWMIYRLDREKMEAAASGRLDEPG